MRINRVYCQSLLAFGAQVSLSPERSHYVQNVLRLKTGMELSVFNENDGEFQAVISHVSKKVVEVVLGQAVETNTESPLYVHIGQGLCRGERMDFVVQKAAELGAREVTPLITEYCEVRLTGERLDKKLLHWRNVAISACEQSGRIKIPIINKPIKLQQWLEQNFDGLKLVADPESSASLPAEVSVSAVTLLIGPEGGLSQEEVIVANQHGYQSWYLGPRILRTETAPIAALSILQARWGDI